MISTVRACRPLWDPIFTMVTADYNTNRFRSERTSKYVRKLYATGQRCQTSLLSLRAALVHIWRDESANPKKFNTKFHLALIERAWEEDFEHPPANSFANVLFCYRGEEAQEAMDLILKVRVPLLSQSRS